MTMDNHEIHEIATMDNHEIHEIAKQAAHETLVQFFLSLDPVS